MAGPARGDVAIQLAIIRPDEVSLGGTGIFAPLCLSDCGTTMIRPLSARCFLPVFLAAALGAAFVLPAAMAEEGQKSPDGLRQASAEQVEKWIAQLGDADYFVRQKAQDELLKFGFEAFDALSVATTDEDLEIASRAKYLLKRMRVEWTVKGDPEEVRKLLADYESQPLPNKLARMRALAELPGGAGFPALCRLVRYEKSPLLSRQAALQLMARRGAGNPPAGAEAEPIRKALAGSSRAASKWILAWLRFAEDPKAAAAEWAKLVEAEMAMVDSAPNDTSPEIAAALIRIEIDRLKKLGDNDRALAAMRRLIDLDEGEPATIADLLDWMIQQKAWNAIDDLANRFKPQFRSQAVLMYGLAQAKAEQGDKVRAEEIASEAFKLNPVKSVEQLIPHLTTAYALKSRGLIPWALREYRYVIDSAPAAHVVTVSARFSLAEMYHDQGSDREAAEELGKLCEVLKNKPNLDVAGRSVGEVRSRMHYFLALEAKRAGDAAKKLDQIEKGLAMDTPDIDLLILAARESDVKPETRQRVEQAVEQSVAMMREQIENAPDEAIGYNQLAWLLGNTGVKEAELDEAVKLSQRSLELSPENGGYYDTLAHCYFRKGDIEKAVRLQERAVELDPHSGLVRAELDVFRAALKEKEKEKKP